MFCFLLPLDDTVLQCERSFGLRARIRISMRQNGRNYHS